MNSFEKPTPSPEKDGPIEKSIKTDKEAYNELSRQKWPGGQYAGMTKSIKETKEFQKELPNDPQELFRMRAEMEARMDTLYQVGKKEEGRSIQNKIHGINRKLNELGVDEPEK